MPDPQPQLLAIPGAAATVCPLPIFTSAIPDLVCPRVQSRPSPLRPLGSVGHGTPEYGLLSPFLHQVPHVTLAASCPPARRPDQPINTSIRNRALTESRSTPNSFARVLHFDYFARLQLSPAGWMLSARINILFSSPAPLKRVPPPPSPPHLRPPECSGSSTASRRTPGSNLTRSRMCSRAPHSQRLNPSVRHTGRLPAEEALGRTS